MSRMLSKLTSYSAIFRVHSALFVRSCDVMYQPPQPTCLTGKHPHGTESLKVRQDPITGPFVEDLSSHEVSDLGGILHVMERGDAERTTAAQPFPSWGILGDIVDY